MFLSPTSLRRTLIPSAVTIAVVLGVLNPAIAQQLIGAGASFPDPLYQRYFTEYQAATGMEVKYSAIGSGGGIQRFINESVEFAGSDAPPTDAEKAQMNQERGLVMVPTAGGAVTVIYNLQGVTTTLRLRRDTLAKIFTGQIGNWKQVSTYLPNRDIRVVVRSDSSGTSFIFSRYLSTITHGQFKASKLPDWGFDVFARRPQNAGVAAEVRRTDGAIGYVQDAYALEHDLPTARIENQAGEFVKPTLEETNQALANVEFNPDFTTDNTQDPNEGYPIVGVTWLLFYERYANQETVNHIKDLVNWILTQGQDLNAEMDYTRIPEDVANRAIDTVNRQIKVSP